jgi:hypothetical protein
VHSVEYARLPRDCAQPPHLPIDVETIRCGTAGDDEFGVRQRRKGTDGVADSLALDQAADEQQPMPARPAGLS